MKNMSVQARLQQAISHTSSNIRELEEQKIVSKVLDDHKGVKDCKKKIASLSAVQKLQKDLMQNIYWRGV